MKSKLLFLAFFLTLFTSLFAQKQIFSIPHLEDTLKKHKIVAILPVRVTISYKRLPKGFDAEANKADEKKTGINM